MDRNVLYGFLGGIFVGKFTNLISSVVIAGVVIYFTEPEFYSYENFHNIKEILTKNI